MSLLHYHSSLLLVIAVYQLPFPWLLLVGKVRSPRLWAPASFSVHMASSSVTPCVKTWCVCTYLRTYPMTSGGRGGAITDLLTTSRHPFRSFDTLRDSSARRQVQSLILSSHRFLWPPLLLPPLTVPCMIVFERPEDVWGCSWKDDVCRVTEGDIV